MKKILKRLRLIALVLVIVLIGGAVLLRLLLPGIIRSQGEKIGSDILGVALTIDDVSLSLLGGNVTISGVAIAPPTGFEAEGGIVSFKRVTANLATRSLLSDTVRVEEVALDGLKVRLQTRADGERSLAALMAGMKKTEPKPEEESEEKPPAGPRTKGIRLDKLAVTNTDILVTDVYTWTEPVTAQVTLAALTLTDVVVPPEGVKDTTAAVLRVEGLKLRTAERFSNPVLYELGELEVQARVPVLVATMAKPVVELPLVAYRNARTHVETTAAGADKPKPENVQEFVVAMQNATSAEPPKRLVDIEAARRAEAEAKKREAEAARKEDSFLSRLGALASNPGAAAPPPPPVEEQPAAEPPFEVVRLEKLEFSAIDFTVVDALARKPPIQAGITEVIGTSIVYPAAPGTQTDIVVRMHALDEDGKVSVKVSGELGEPVAGRNTAVLVNVRNLPLDSADGVQSGRLNADIDLKLVGTRLVGTVRFNLQEFKADASRNRTLAVLTSGPMGTVINDPDMWVPISLDMDVNDQNWQQIVQGVVLETTVQLSKAAAEAIKAKALEAAGQIGSSLQEAGRQLQDSINASGAADSLRQGAGQVGSELEKAGDEAKRAIEGLFGRRRSEEKK